jgi:outer membrane receptor protein involved in Fe transport
VQEIADAVNDQTTVNAWVDWNGNPGAYLCEYMAYLGMWYQDIHNTTDDPYPCWSSGFIHVTAGLPLEDAIEATEITLREVINYLLNLNSPPDTPAIDGPTNGKAGVQYNYTFNSVDPDDDDVYYYIKWDDGYTEVWDGPHASGVDFEIKHTYTKQGTFTIEAKAKDSQGEESDWGILEVTMPKYKPIDFNLNILNRLFERFPHAFPILRYLL